MRHSTLDSDLKQVHSKLALSGSTSAKKESLTCLQGHFYNNLLGNQGGSSRSPPISLNDLQENRDYLEYCNSNEAFSSIFQSKIPEFIDKIDWSKIGIQKSSYFKSLCGKIGYQQKCTCKAYNFKPILCGDRLGCPICNRSYAVKMGSKAFHKFYEYGSQAVIHLVLTYPSGYFSNDLSKIEIFKLVMKHTKEFVKRLWFGKVGRLSTVHSWGTSDPTRYPHWHSHSIVGIRDTSKQQYFFTPDHLEQLRLKWADIIGVIDDRSDKVNLHFEYRLRYQEDFIGKVKHWCNYLYRGVVVDLNEYLKENSLSVLDPGQQSRYDYHQKYPEKFQRVRWSGDLGNSVFRKTFQRLGCSVDKMEYRIHLDKEIFEKYFCYSCGEELKGEWKFGGFIPPDQLACKFDDWDRYASLVRQPIQRDRLIEWLYSKYDV